VVELLIKDKLKGISWEGSVLQSVGYSSKWLSELRTFRGVSRKIPDTEIRAEPLLCCHRLCSPSATAVNFNSSAFFFSLALFLPWRAHLVAQLNNI
jgi:hypothetical protein